MNDHRHLTAEEIWEQASGEQTAPVAAGCSVCEAEVASLAGFVSEMKRVDASALSTTEWDDLLLRRRIREAVAREKPHVTSIFRRFPILRPALAAAAILLLAVAAWSPLSGLADVGGGQKASLDLRTHDRLPAWTALPNEDEDEGLAVLAEWTPTEDELAIARCRASCLAGLSSHEEERLFTTVAMNVASVPMTVPSPL